jgi:hypothetical protein
LMLALGLLLILPLSLGTLTIGPIVFSLYWMLLGVTLATLGLQCVYLGVIAQVFFDYTGDRTRVWFSRFPYTRTVGIAALLFLAGLVLTTSLIVSYVRHDFQLADGNVLNHLGVTGLFLLIAGFTTFTFTLILHSTAVVVWRR